MHIILSNLAKLNISDDKFILENGQARVLVHDPTFIVINYTVNIKLWHNVTTL